MQLEFFDIPSPCIGMCESDGKGHCLGCMRSRDERQNWKDFSSNEKKKVIKRCVQRKKRKKNKHNKKSKIAESKVQVIQENELGRQPSLLDPPKQIKTQSNTDVDTSIDFSDFEL